MLLFALFRSKKAFIQKNDNIILNIYLMVFFLYAKKYKKMFKWFTRYSNLIFFSQKLPKMANICKTRIVFKKSRKAKDLILGKFFFQIFFNQKCLQGKKKRNRLTDRLTDRQTKWFIKLLCTAKKGLTKWFIKLLCTAKKGLESTYTP